MAPAALLYTVFVNSPRYPGYMHLLVTYQFRFVRRALVGTVLSWFTEAVPILVRLCDCDCRLDRNAFVLFVRCFGRYSEFEPEIFPLFVFVVG